MLVSSLARKLNTEVPGIEGNEDKVKVLRGQVLSSKSVESRDGISKVTRVSNMFPSQGCQARYRGMDMLADFSLTGLGNNAKRERKRDGENVNNAGFVQTGVGSVNGYTTRRATYCTEG